MPYPAGLHSAAPSFSSDVAWGVGDQGPGVGREFVGNKEGFMMAEVGEAGLCSREGLLCIKSQ